VVDATVVVTAVAGSVSALAGTASSIAAWRSALASGKTAKESREALAYATRPYLALHAVRENNLPDSATTETVEIRNAAGFPAEDVKVVVHDSNGRLVGSGDLPFIKAQTPNSWAGEAPLRIDLSGLAPLQKIGDTRSLTATIRASDRQHIIRWEQQVKFIRKVVPPTDNDPRSLIDTEVYEVSEPRAIAKSG
jgi:hypothetical protein